MINSYLSRWINTEPLIIHVLTCDPNLPAEIPVCQTRQNGLVRILVNLVKIWFAKLSVLMIETLELSLSITTIGAGVLTKSSSPTIERGKEGEEKGYGKEAGNER